MAQGTRRRRPIFFLFLLLLFAIAAVWSWLWMQRSTTPNALRLVRVTFGDLPGWRNNDPHAALAAFRRSCAALAGRNPLTTMGGAGYAGTIGDWLASCRAAPQTQSAAASRRFFETWFMPFAVNKDIDAGLFTGYYEPELRASHTQHGPYQTPIHGLPDDLIKVDLGLFKDALKGEHVTGMVHGTTLVPYPTRAAIDEKGLAHARILVWGDDPVAVFFLHIQGSGRAVLDDGTTVRIAYAGQNGRPYTPIGRVLIAQGAMSRADMSMQGIRAWLKTHPADARRVMETDASYVFFEEKPLGDPSLGADGSQGLPLTPGASLAVDTDMHPLGAPVWLALDDHSTAIPRERLMVAQDTGGAIKGAVRGDVFFGFGDKPEWNAGHMKASGAMYILLPKALARQLPAAVVP